MIRVVHPGSRSQKGTGSRIRIRKNGAVYKEISQAKLFSCDKSILEMWWDIDRRTESEIFC